MSFTRIYAQTTYLTSYARSPYFERSWYGSQTGASLLPSTSYKKMKVKSIKSNSSFQKKHTTSQIESGNIFFLRCTQCHVGLHPSEPRDHTQSHTEVAPQSALPINGTGCLIRIHITLQVSLMICLVLDPIIRYTLHVPHIMLFNHKVNMSQCVHRKANI